MLELLNIHKQWGDRTIIRDLSLSALPGRILCLTGPSGVGKTTVLELAAGLLQPDQGERRFPAGRLAYAFQSDVLIPWRTAAQNLEFVQDTRRNPAGAQRSIAKWLGRFGLEDAAGQYPKEISGGMCRRLNLARAFCLEPDLLILDEPFAFLDQQWLERITSYLAEAISRGAAVLMASHQMAPLSGLSCRSMVIESQNSQAVSPPAVRPNPARETGPLKDQTGVAAKAARFMNRRNSGQPLTPYPNTQTLTLDRETDNEHQNNNCHRPGRGRSTVLPG